MRNSDNQNHRTFLSWSEARGEIAELNKKISEDFTYHAQSRFLD